MSEAANAEEKRKALENLARLFKKKPSLDDPEYKGVNQILVYQFKNERPTYYVPCYIRMKVNRVSDINYIEGSATIECDIRLWVMIK